MKKENIGSQFEQLPLYSEEESSWPPRLEPHMMSPEQFRSHPFTVFHASYAPNLPDVGRKGYPDSKFNGLHAGTEQAALERLSTLGPHKSYNENTKAVLHHINLMRYGINRLDSPMSDENANNENEQVNMMGRPTAYTNEVEDSGALSVVIPRIPGPLTHEDYVREAIEKGKEHEVHPTTLALYKANKLKERVHYRDAERQLTDSTEQDHNGGLFPFYKRVYRKNPNKQSVKGGFVFQTNDDVVPTSREEFVKDFEKKPSSSIKPLGTEAEKKHLSSKIKEYKDSYEDRHGATWRNNETVSGNAWESGNGGFYAPSIDQLVGSIKPYRRVSDAGDVRNSRQFNNLQGPNKPITG